MALIAKGMSRIADEDYAGEVRTKCSRVGKKHLVAACEGHHARSIRVDVFYVGVLMKGSDLELGVSLLLKKYSALRFVGHFLGWNCHSFD